MLCPNCKNIIDDDSNFCRFCGVEFVGEEEQIEIITEDEPDYSVGEDETTFYAESSYDEPENIFSTKKKKKATAKIVFVIIILLFVCAGLIAAGFGTGVFGGAGKETVTDAAGEKVRPGWGTTEITVKDIDGTTRVIESDKSLVTPSQILEEYTAVMNSLKDDAPAFSMTRYQNLPSDKQNLGSVAEFVLPIIEKYVTSKSAAKTEDVNAGNANKLPVKESPYGCLLTDATKIKNAYCEILSDDMYKIVMTFNDELNPGHLSPGAESSDGIINAVFDPYDAAEQITAISSMIMHDINFNYTDCTVTLVYNPDTKQVQSVDMLMNIDITAKTILMDINARIVDITEFAEFVY